MRESARTAAVGVLRTLFAEIRGCGRARAMPREHVGVGANSATIERSIMIYREQSMIFDQRCSNPPSREGRLPLRSRFSEIVHLVSLFIPKWASWRCGRARSRDGGLISDLTPGCDISSPPHPHPPRYVTRSSIRRISVYSRGYSRKRRCERTGYHWCHWLSVFSSPFFSLCFCVPLSLSLSLSLVLRATLNPFPGHQEQAGRAASARMQPRDCTCRCELAARERTSSPPPPSCLVSLLPLLPLPLLPPASCHRK